MTALESVWEGLAVAYLCDSNDPTLLSRKELKDSWGNGAHGPQYPCCNFMLSYGLKPYNSEDCEEAINISRALKENSECQKGEQISEEEDNSPDTDSTLPEIGRWIKISIADREFRCKVCSYEVESFGGLQDTERYFVVEYEGGDDDSLDEKFLNTVNWSYIPAPGKEEIETAVLKRNNRVLGYSCQTCKSTSNKLVKCSACKKVHYCNQDCQRKDWPTHQEVCSREKVVLQPNPRYPLAEVKQQMAIAQKKLQDDNNAALKDGFNGNFKIRINGVWVKNPKATDLVGYNSYELKHDSGEDKVVYYKHRLDSGEHARGEPTSCDLLMRMEMSMEDDFTSPFKEGGLHYLVGWQDPGYFWVMLMNFFTFGTVAPFHTNCYCNFPKMPPKYKVMRKKWDKMFSRAKVCPTDVQCMFADTTVGCHSFGLMGDAGCKFKHDIAIKKAKK